MPDTAILFDLDGVLADSRVAISGCISDAPETQGAAAAKA